MHREYLQTHDWLLQDLDTLHPHSILSVARKVRTPTGILFPFKKAKIKVRYSILTKIKQIRKHWRYVVCCLPPRHPQPFTNLCNVLSGSGSNTLQSCRDAHNGYLCACEFISPILLRSFVSTGGWYVHYWFSFKTLHWHFCAPGGMGAGRQAEFKGTQLRNGSELRSLNISLLPLSMSSPYIGGTL